MIRLFLIGLLLLPGLLLSAQGDTARALVLSGELFNKLDSLPIANVHIMNLQSGKATVTNRAGAFAINAHEADTIKITAIGYYDGYIYLKDIPYQERVHLNIFLELQVYELDSATVYSFMSKEEFRKQFLQMEPAKDSLFLNLPNPNEWGIVAERSKSNPGFKISGPITAVYNALNKKKKQEREYQALLVSEKQKAVAQKKYNAAYVMRLTGLEDEAEVNEFMRFCNLTDAYVNAVTEYELALAVQDCFDEFIAAK